MVFYRIFRTSFIHCTTVWDKLKFCGYKLGLNCPFCEWLHEGFSQAVLDDCYRRRINVLDIMEQELNENDGTIDFWTELEKEDSDSKVPRDEVVIV